MTRRWWPGLALLALALTAAAAVGAERFDRLDRFRALATTRLGLADGEDGERTAEAVRELFALLDEEIVESLASGSVFASLAFLQDRLDGFAQAWGGATLRAERVGPFTVGAFQLSELPGASAVRVYGTVDGEAQLIAAVQRAGRPTVVALPGRPGAARFLVAWEGRPDGRSTRPLRLDVFGQDRQEVRLAWTTAEEFPDGLPGRHWRLRGPLLTVRYELRYPGWAPGCEVQTEQEDVYRLAPDEGGFVRLRRLQHHGWHAAFRRTVAAFFEAVAAGDGRRLAELVPDPGLRRRLPGTLAPEPACDAPDAAEPRRVSVAAVGPQGRPWSLGWERGERGWRLTGARPVLE